MKRILPLVALMMFVVWLVACSSGSNGRTVNQTIEMTEYSFQPATLDLRVGDQVMLKLVNKGALEHEIMFGRDVMMEEGRPSGYQTDMFDAAGTEPKVKGGEVAHSHTHGGHMVVIPPGKETTLSFTVEEKMAGEWEMGCFLLSGTHYDSGMKGKVVVTGQ